MWCIELKLIWNEKLGMKPSPSVPKTLHSIPTFAQNVHTLHPSNASYGHISSGSLEEKEIQIMSQLTRKYPYHHEQQNNARINE